MPMSASLLNQRSEASLKKHSFIFCDKYQVLYSRIARTIIFEAFFEEKQYFFEQCIF